MTSTPVFLASLLQFKKSVFGATLFGDLIRADPTREFLCVVDAVQVVEMSLDRKLCQFKVQRLMNTGVIKDSVSSGFQWFDDEDTRIMFGTLHAVAKLCEHLKGARARAITEGLARGTQRTLERSTQPSLAAPVAPDGFSALCEFQKTETGATLMGRQIRVDETGHLLSVKDAISAIEGTSSNAAHKKYQRLIDANVIVEGTSTGFEKFRHENIL